MKAHDDFHIIKWKPLDRRRRAAQDKASVIQWFKDYEDLKRKFNIRPQDLQNFDKTGFCLACPKCEDVWVPKEINKVCSLPLNMTFIYTYILAVIL